MEMTAFERNKRQRNIADGYKETKGLQNGHCNRRACQAPLSTPDGRPLPQSYMRDHETASDGKLFYCLPCTRQFDEADARFGDPRRCTVVPPPAVA